MLKRVRLKILQLSLLVGIIGLFTNQTYATHIIGGELIYDCLGLDSVGNYQYRITLKVYRDCSPGTAGYDNPAYISIWDGSATPSFITNFTIPFPGAVQLPFVSNDPCFIPPSGICVEEAIYQTIISIPPNVNGFVFAYQRCCRNNSIINIPGPGSIGATYSEAVPDTILCNNSPRFNNFPPIALCLDNPLVFDHSATDPDGDSLVYYICTPYEGASAADSYPAITSAPPFTPVTFTPPYTALDPIAGSPALAINPITGQLTLTPTLVGQYVVGICCDEYRNGVLIGTHSREFQFNVVDCTQISPVSISSGTIINGVLTNDSVFTEGCEAGLFIIHRDSISTTDTLTIVKGGNAIEGVDYDPIPNQIIIPVGVADDTIFVTANADTDLEGIDTLNLTLTYQGLCGTTVATRNIYIEDYIPMTAILEGDTTLCPSATNAPFLTPVVTGGFGGYNFLWYPTNDTVANIYANVGETTVFYVNVEDDCEKTITSQPVTIVIQCPIIIPNVITANSDGLNDVFFIQNIEQYPENEVWFYNRWGTLLHYEKGYKNDWTPDVTDGVYFYVVDDKVNDPHKDFFTVFMHP